MKKSIASLVTCIPVLWNVCFARPHLKPQVADQQLVIHLYNLADVSSRRLDQAMQQATLVLATAGVKAVWQQGASDAKEAHTVDLSKPLAWKIQNPSVRKPLVLVLIRDVPADYLKGALGRAFPEAQTGINAMIFYDRIERLKQSDEIDTSAVLGLALAHEIGHVLLQSVAHSQAGIMKSPWTKADIQHAAARLSEFDALERGMISGRTLPAASLTANSEPQ